LYFGWSALSRSTKRREDRDAMQARANKAVNTCASRVNAADPTKYTLLGTKIQRLTSSVDADTIEGLQRKLQEVKQRTEAFGKTFADAQQSSDPSQKNLSQSVYAEMARTYEDLVEEGQAIDRIESSVTGDIDSFNRQIESAPKQVTALDAKINGIAASVGRLRSNGYGMGTIDAELELALTAHELAKAAIDRKQFNVAIDKCVEGTRHADQASSLADELPKLKQRVPKTIQETDQSLIQVRVAISDGGADVDASRSEEVSRIQIINTRVSTLLSGSAPDYHEAAKLADEASQAATTLGRAVQRDRSTAAQQRRAMQRPAAQQSTSRGYGGGGSGGGYPRSRQGGSRSSTNVIVQGGNSGGVDPLLAGVLGYELGRNAQRDDDEDRLDRRGRGNDDSDNRDGGGGSIDFDAPEPAPEPAPDSDRGGGGSIDFGSDDDKDDSPPDSVPSAPDTSSNDDSSW
jgi:hypothetical protein